MRILTAASRMSTLDELERELTAIFPDAEIIKETDALMAGKYAFNHAVDIVFAEADMKRMNGLELIRFVRQEHPDVKSFLIGPEKEFAESFLVVSEDVTGVVVYPFTENAVRDAWQGSRQRA